MKKKLLWTGIFLTVALSMFAAGSKEKVSNDLPDFVLSPPKSESAIYGVGYAKMAHIDQSMAAAKTRARAEIAKQLETQIQSVLTDYFQQAGESQKAQNLQFVESITREITNKKLTNTVNEKTYADKEGGIWVLVSFSKQAAVDAFETVANDFARSEEAAFSEFKAKEAAAMLDRLISEHPTQSAAVKE